MSENVPQSRTQELLELTQEARAHLVMEISANGLEPGCWLRVDDGDLTHDVVEIRRVLDAVGEMEALEGNFSEIEEFDGEHAWDPPQDGADAWIILTQSCDLIRDVAEEPFVQVALLRQAPEGFDLPARARRSARLIPLDPTGEKSRYYADLRCQAFIPKHLLAGVDVRQAIPLDAEFGKQRPRTRFALRVGQRYSRMGIPTEIVISIVRPIETVLGKKKDLRKRLDAAFSEWLLVPTQGAEGRPRLVAVTPHEADADAFREAEDLFVEEFLEALPTDVRERLDEEGSQVVSLDDLLQVIWITGWRLDLDYLTFGIKGDPEAPGPTA